jgi:hypothetical protein
LGVLLLLALLLLGCLKRCCCCCCCCWAIKLAAAAAAAGQTLRLAAAAALLLRIEPELAALVAAASAVGTVYATLARCRDKASVCSDSPAAVGLRVKGQVGLNHGARRTEIVTPQPCRMVARTVLALSIFSPSSVAATAAHGVIPAALDWALLNGVTCAS